MGSADLACADSACDLRSSGVGAFAVKLAGLSNIHPTTAVAGKGIDFVQSILDPSKGDAAVDYRMGVAAVVSGIRLALRNAGVKDGSSYHAFDAVCAGNSTADLLAVLSRELHPVTNQKPKITYTSPLADPTIVPAGIDQEVTNVSLAHAGTQAQKDFAFTWLSLIGRGLEQGQFKGHRFHVVPGGLDGVERRLFDLKNGNASALKYVYRIAEK